MVEAPNLAPDALRRVSRLEYERLVREGWFQDERIELLCGLLVAITPQGAPHAHVVSQLNALLTPALRGRAVVRVQSPLALTAESEPEPDLAVVPSGDYRQGHPSSAILVIEVAETSLTKDQQVKAPLYAEGGVPEYWLVNLVDRVVEVHTGPIARGYRQITRYHAGDALAPAAFPDVSVPVDEILP